MSGTLEMSGMYEQATRVPQYQVSSAFGSSAGARVLDRVRRRCLWRGLLSRRIEGQSLSVKVHGHHVSLPTLAPSHAHGQTQQAAMQQCSRGYRPHTLHTSFFSPTGRSGAGQQTRTRPGGRRGPRRGDDRQTVPTEGPRASRWGLAPARRRFIMAT